MRQSGLGEGGISVQQVEALLRAGNAPAAEQAARALAKSQPRDWQAQVLLGHALRLSGQTRAALDAAKAALVLAPSHPAPRMLQAQLLLQCGERTQALEVLRALVADGDDQPRLLQDIAQHFTGLGLHEDAERCLARARVLRPDDPQALYNHASAQIALGQLAEAEASLDRVIALTPDDGDAWYNRATLRRQTPENNHVNALRQRCARTPPDSANMVPLHYALAKELEDLGQYAESFDALQRGAHARRQRLSYRVEDDLDTMRQIAAAFDAGFFARNLQGHADARPLFIVGLPRSGTTLVDRILASHPQVISRGETTDLAMALMHGAGQVQSKQALVQRATALDFSALGAHYCAQLPDSGALRMLDKTPINFLYLGILAKALPQARIVHLRRHPMAACHAMYKTLFRMAYPFSYDLDDLARYWLGYAGLMAHWRTLLPAGQMLEIDYEDLVEHQEAVSRRLLAHAGLDWDPACLHFERNRQPSLTASAAQVRQPIYRSSLDLWRRYAAQLAPVATRLRAAGMDPDSGNRVPA